MASFRSLFLVLLGCSFLVIGFAQGQDAPEANALPGLSPDKKEQLSQKLNVLRNNNPLRTNEAIEERKPPSRNSGGSQMKLSENEMCSSDIKAICPNAKNNFAVLDCLQENRKSDQELSDECQHVIWAYKMNLTKDARFDSAAASVCKSELQKLEACRELESGAGYRISCLVEHKQNITSPGCRKFINKMGSIVFSDYRLICNFAEDCKAEIGNTSCGRLHSGQDDSPHTQGATILCLEKHVAELGDQCKTQILRIAELQSDDFHLNRPLYYACRDDREKFCKEVTSGHGAVLKCLTKHKFDRTMSDECREQLTGVQKLMAEDVKINRPLMDACKSAIRQHHCFKQQNGLKLWQARQAHLILCLENAMTEDKHSVDGKCRSEVRDTRRAIMQDYKVSPNLVRACHNEISSRCGGGLDRDGKTLHCLMGVIRDSEPDDEETMGSECRAEVEKLIEKVNPGEDISLDPVIARACAPVVDKLCKEKHPEEMMSCLMDHIESVEMRGTCRDRLLELQFFISRNFKLSPKLFTQCRAEAREKCDVKRRDYGDVTHHGATFACLYRLGRSDKLSRGCAFEVRRTLRQRAVAVDLNPRIQEPCINDLSLYCRDAGKGKELECLQENYDSLDEECRTAVGNFTEDEDKDPEMDRALMRACAPMIKDLCKDVLSENNAQPGDVMECLIKKKNDEKMNEKCRAGIEHHQLVSLADFRFTFKFKEACKKDVEQHCKDQTSNKAKVVECLSQMIRDDTLKSISHHVSAACRKQVTFELLQRSEDVKLDPRLQNTCESDISSLCAEERGRGNGAVLRCLQKHGKDLSERCAGLVLKRSEVEAANVKADFPLFTQCKRMIKTHCADVAPGGIFACLREHKNTENFDKQCKKMLLERMRERATDIRLNPNLERACRADVDKYCQMDNTVQSRLPGIFEAKVLTCLRIHFAKKQLSESCEQHLGGMIKEAAVDYKQNPLLARACQQEIQSECLKAVSAQDLDDHGQVEECLKHMLANKQISNRDCEQQILQVIKESKVDVHVDIILFKACAIDIQHHCVGVPRGEGRQMSCLLDVLDDKKSKLRPECDKMMRERRDLWQNAAQVAPAEDFNELMLQVHASPQRNYLYGVMLTFLGLIFIGGLTCGRVTKRVRRELKNR